jgi:hypothetical protein
VPVLRLPPGHVLQSYGFLLAHLLDEAFELWQSSRFSPPAGPPGKNSGRSSATRPPRPSATVPDSGRPGHRAFFLVATRIEEAPHAASGGAGAAPPPKTTTGQISGSHRLLHPPLGQGGWTRLVSNMGHRLPRIGAC